MAVPVKGINCSDSADTSPMIPSLELNCKPANFDCKVDRGLTCEVSTSNVVCSIPDENKCINLKSLASSNPTLSWKPEKPTEKTTEKPTEKPTVTAKPTTPTTTKLKQIPSLSSEHAETSASQMVGIAAALGLVQLQLF